MNHNEDKNKRIYLYSHSPEAEKAIESGEVAISTGGARRSDGTMMDMAKPLSFTLDELKEMVSDEKQFMVADKKIKQIGEKLQLSEEGMQEISRIGWLNNAAIGQAYSMTYAGFQRTLSGLEYIASNMEEFRQYVRQRDFNDLKEKTERFITYLESDMRKLELPRFDVTNSNVDEHINDIGSFIKRMYVGLLDGSEDGFFACIIINALIVPFTEVLKKYAVLFFYDNGVTAGGCNKWSKLISDISSDQRFREKIQYYIHLETDMPYKDKIVLGCRCLKKVVSLPDSIAFDAEYALYHSKEEYLSKSKDVKKIIDISDGIPDDGKLYL